jgi:hypothetical protein
MCWVGVGMRASLGPKLGVSSQNLILRLSNELVSIAIAGEAHTRDPRFEFALAGRDSRIAANLIAVGMALLAPPINPP